MKLIIREYLSSLRERGELDAILPDLLSQIGLNVFSRPGIGTRQEGVDVAAVGRIDGGAEKVYLFSIKSGDLSRGEWDTNSVQSLRPSLTEIIDSYIPTRLPVEHRDKDIVICICIGGDVKEPVRSSLTNYISRNTTDNITFEEWNGDKLASFIQSNFLSEDLLPESARSNLRKSLALLDEPEASHRHFAELVRSLSDVDKLKGTNRITAIRQVSICLWILFAWARDAKNMESAYLSGEFALLHAWNIVKDYMDSKKKNSKAIQEAFISIFTAYRQICKEYLSENVLPYVNKLHALSSAIYSSCDLDINLKLFDLVGRLGVNGIWSYWDALICSNEQLEQQESMLDVMQTCISSIKSLILNNPALLLPVKDDQAIDIAIAVHLLALDPNSRNDIGIWLYNIMNRAGFAYRTHGRYPCTINSYSELLSHPKTGNQEYRKDVTAGSILYPMIAIWAALLDNDELYSNVALMKQQELQHCNFQYWYPDDNSEKHFYINDDLHHGAVLSGIAVDRPKQELLAQVFGECDRSPHYKKLSAVKSNWWPLIIVACRHYRFPLPLHFLEEFRNEEPSQDSEQ